VNRCGLLHNCFNGPDITFCSIPDFRLKYFNHIKCNVISINRPVWYSHTGLSHLYVTLHGLSMQRNAAVLTLITTDLIPRAVNRQWRRYFRVARILTLQSKLIPRCTTCFNVSKLYVLLKKAFLGLFVSLIIRKHSDYTYIYAVLTGTRASVIG
jgi:hypothetical protein